VKPKSKLLPNGNWQVVHTETAPSTSG